MASEPTLPEELLLKIFGFIDDRHTLLDVLSVSHLFRRLGEMILYESVIIKNLVYTKSVSQFRDTLATREELGACVKSLALLLELGDSMVVLVAFIHLGPRDPVSDILYKLPNLRKLSVRCDIFPVNLPNPNSVVPPFALTHLRWNNPSSDDGKSLKAFLESQPSIQFLDIRANGADVRVWMLSEKALPRLRVLLANTHAAFDIFPTRHVVHLEVGIRGDLAVQWNDHHVQASLEHVQSLHCSTRLSQDATRFAAKFFNLKYFSIRCNTTLDGDTRNMATELVELLLVLNNKNIKYIALTFEIESVPKLESIRALFEALPTLLAVDFRALRKNRNSYHRYTRGSSSPSLGRDPSEVDANSWDLWWQNRGFQLEDDNDTDRRRGAGPL